MENSAINRYQGGQRRGGHHNSHQWGNNSRNNSYRSDSNSNSSFGQDNKSNIDAYLHPSMLQDPWASLRQKDNQT
ncbi:hypothetical protein K1T71_004343 [Dendrolimus kikuchii]|uniref:Uncharacterized protein n=1 Tax=Dendrolimus kikuchii TaxID=765133 RepID=A0ACC1D8L3_9NEOP|nr:hypothetical protein K1T71_004343 [Dendrolimus kikuchii]